MAVMSSAALHEQLSIIMGALTKAAVLEICELVGEGYAALQREVTRRRKENDDLRKKLHLIESIVVRGGGGGGATESATLEAQIVGSVAEEAQRQDSDGGDAAAVVLREGFPDVVLIKDEGSDSNETFEEVARRPAADGGAAAVSEARAPTQTRQRPRRTHPKGDDAARKLPADCLNAPKKKVVSGYSLDSPRSELEAGESGSSYSSQMDSDVHLVQDCSLVPPSSNRQVQFSCSVVQELPSRRPELDSSVDSAWAKQSRGPVAYAQFQHCENVEGESFGLKVINVSGSTSTDCQLSESSSSAFEYEDAEMLSYALYGEQSGPSQLCSGQHGGARRKRFVCSHCNKSYATAQNLDVHMRLHTGERPFSCSHCGKKFTQSAHLKSHLNIHTGERPFVCSLCSKSFIAKYSLKLHMKKYHQSI